MDFDGELAVDICFLFYVYLVFWVVGVVGNVVAASAVDYEIVFGADEVDDRVTRNRMAASAEVHH